MIIRKKFSFEGAHIVRNCTSERCKYSIHGHSFEVEIFLRAQKLDRGHMIYDFGLMKSCIKQFIDSFDHATMYWSLDDQEYIKFIKKFSARYIALPCSTSAEMLALLFLKGVSLILSKTKYNNQEDTLLEVSSVRLHETKSGYAEAELEDLSNPLFPEIDLKKIIFSDAIKKDWIDSNIWDSLLYDENFFLETPSPEIQVLE